MIDEKLTQRPELASTPSGDDWLYIVDASDPTDSPEGTSKKVKVSTAGFNSQATQISTDGDEVVISDSEGTELDRTNIAGTQDKIHYDLFEYREGIPDDLSGLTITSPFTVIQTVTNVYYFISAVNNIEKFNQTRIFLNNSGQYADLSVPDTTEANFYAWEIPVLTGTYTDGNNYKFNFWIKSTSNPMSPWVSIDGLLVRQASGNIGSATVQPSDMIVGEITAGNMVMAIVNSLPYTNKSNLSLFFDAEL